MPFLKTLKKKIKKADALTVNSIGGWGVLILACLPLSHIFNKFFNKLNSQIILSTNEKIKFLLIIFLTILFSRIIYRKYCQIKFKKITKNDYFKASGILKIDDSYFKRYPLYKVRYLFTDIPLFLLFLLCIYYDFTFYPIYILALVARFYISYSVMIPSYIKFNHQMFDE